MVHATWQNAQDGAQLPFEVSIVSPALVGAETAPRDRRVQVADESITVILFEYVVKCPHYEYEVNGRDRRGELDWSSHQTAKISAGCSVATHTRAPSHTSVGSPFRRWGQK